VFDPAQDPNAPGAPRALGGGAVAAAGNTSEEPIGAPGGRAAGAPLDLSSLSQNTPPAENGALPPPPARNTSATGTRLATLPPSASPKDEYDLAYGYVLHKDYALAEQAFRDFIKKYPGERQIAEANYWLGETLFQRQRYQDAADSFLVVVRNHEKSAKAPEALLRLGQSLAALGQKEMGCASLAEVERKYPRASSGVKKNVAQEQKRAHC
jgi:tol-pal system protein YbgF